MSAELGIVWCPSIGEVEGIGPVRCDLGKGHTSEHRHYIGGTAHTWPNYNPAPQPLERIADALEGILAWLERQP